MSLQRFEIDNITWNDLSLDDIYARLNFCETSAGEYYLKDSIKRPYLEDCTDLREYVSLSEELKSNKIAEGLHNSLLAIGKLKKYDFKTVLCEYDREEKESNVKHIIVDLLIILSFLMIFVYPGPGVVAFIALVAYSVSCYFKEKNIISSKLYVFSYLIKMLKIKIHSCEELEKNSCEYITLKKFVGEINDIKLSFKPFMRWTFLISESARTNSNPIGIIFDYLRMIFHVDIIKYNNMISFIKANRNKAERIYSLIGEIDCALSINKALSELCDNEDKTVCKPQFVVNGRLNISGLYHPLIDNPVCNNIECDKNVLITGCNASGKSTFLKSTAIAVLFAQSFGLTFAKSYSAPFYKIYSSMALKDDLSAGESYFMSEIKSIKRIIDISESDKVFCVIDEVLRGTNTVERIASSVEILKCLSKNNVLCFAATHDIELTEILSDYYDNYHFSEEFTDEDIQFSYKLKAGAATSRNAIRLLSLLGYDSEIVKNASKRADEFIKSGKWN